MCHGNICRSPFAHRYCETAMDEARARSVRVDGAGFIRPNRPSPPAAIQAADEMEVDLREHRSRLLEYADLEIPGTVVLVMEPAQRRRILRKGSIDGDRVLVLGDLDPEPVRRRRILDPVERPVEEFRTVYRRIARCVDALLEALPEGEVPRTDRDRQGDGELRGDPPVGTSGRSGGGP